MVPERAARRGRRHDADAGGDPEVLAAKAALRERIWADLDRPGVARFPKPANRIPNFVGAEAAARRLAATDEWAAAATVKSNPDSPQWPVRTLALTDGKIVYMAVPRLAERDPFFLLDPARLADAPRTASSIKGASRSARTVDVDELQPVDLVVTGCVGVDESGARLGKGGGFSDLEFAVAAGAGLVDAGTVVVTTVHERQVLPTGHGAHHRPRPPRRRRRDARAGAAVPAAAGLGPAADPLGRAHRGQDRRDPAAGPAPGMSVIRVRYDTNICSIRCAVMWSTRSRRC